MNGSGGRWLRNWGLLFAWLPASLAGQTGSEMQQVLERLERLEQENRALMEEVRGLRRDLQEQGTMAKRLPESGMPGLIPPSPAGETDAAPEALLSERLAVQEQRTEELAQTKVETVSKSPLRIRGMALFNAFWNGPYNAGMDYPNVAPLEAGERRAGGTLRQSSIGLDYDGGQTVLGAKVHGSLILDFFGGSSANLEHYLRIRTAAVELEWNRTTLMFGQEKPIISPREPTSLAQVGVSPLTQTGNLWLWQPQVRIEQRFLISETVSWRAQIGLLQTAESVQANPAAERARPALEGRFPFAQEFGGGRRFEFAPGFHFSTTHVAGASVPSRIASADWLVAPVRQVQFTGMLFRGQNVPVLGGLRPGYNFRPNGAAVPVRSTGGWAQVAYFPTQRLSFHAYGGVQDDNNTDLAADAIDANQKFAGNAIYRLSPNVLLSFEASQLRTKYLGSRLRRNNHYDLAIAYQF